MPRAYYNEIDRYAAQWLRNLSDAGLIAPGDVDERDIRDVQPSDLEGYTQCHFFAGIGIWSGALRAAGWPDDRPVWTGSCPCQPFSASGRKAGFADERHLWPHFFHLILERQPAKIMGEQVASPDGLAWLDLVQSDMEGTGHAFGALDLCSAGVGAPNIRQRLYWVAERVADNQGERWDGIEASAAPTGREISKINGRIGRVAGADSGECDGRADAAAGNIGNGENAGRSQGYSGLASGIAIGKLAHAHDTRSQGRCERRNGALEWPFGPGRVDSEGRSPVDGFWRDADWLHCRDEKWRAVEPGTFPLVDGDTARVGKLRAYGNAINFEVAKAAVEAYCEMKG